MAAKEAGWSWCFFGGFFRSRLGRWFWRLGGHFLAHWSFDADFLRSNWQCIWGRGCQGILDHPAEHLGQGCCSVGAELSVYDPFTDASVPLKLHTLEANKLVVSLSATDYPRFLVVEER